MPCLSLFTPASQRPHSARRSFFNVPHALSVAVGLGGMLTVGSISAHADSLGALIAQKSVQADDGVPPARISNRIRIQPSSARANVNAQATISPSYTSTRRSASYQSTSQPAQSSYRISNQSGRQMSSADNAPATRNTYATRYVTSNTYSAPTYSTSYSAPQPAQQSISHQASMALLNQLTRSQYDNVDSAHLPLVSNAESVSNQAVREVMNTARVMALNERAIIKGGCWDYLNAVFNRAGVSRSTVHKGEYRGGPYANREDIQVGDWLYYINHGYNDIEHSGLFVGWVDKEANQALILSYAGENRHEPARYRVYDLSHVYNIMRPNA
ncbi:hypothetical protein [Psychrobacter aestuarii]|uniref:CHAP domain-containing protein n=1 Tax=Psychrobacter aestuarii TaxID=556327 RepID=A0ABN0VT76_9GAMM|nr:hypothetical protein [Psychrobacter aestuarii]